MTRTGDREVGVVCGRLPDNLGELACMDTERGRIRDESVDSITRGFRAEARA